MSELSIEEIDTEYAPTTNREPTVDDALFAKGYSRIPSVLKRLGFEKLRAGQDEAIYSVLAGVDSICILPTAAGKSLIFIVPALCHGWKTIVFSPLKALMRDQVKKLQGWGVSAFAVSSDSSSAENDYALQQWVEGECDILYIAPERLMNDTFKQVLRQRPPEMVCIDEAHTLSAWTDNFRHAYTYIGDAIERYQPKVVLAVTATFNQRIEEDVRRVLGLPKAKKIVSYTPRMNLHLSSSEMRSQQDVLDKVRETDGKILIYCGWKKNCEKYAQFLSRALEEEVGIYHSQVTGTVKKSTQDRFARKNDLRIVCATNAFGMGVDIPDIEAVIHIIYPGDPESLDQETGRGGRSGQDCACHTFQSRGAHDFQMKLLESGHPTRPLFERVFDVMKRKADKDGVFHMDAMEIQELSRVEIDYQTAIIQTLQGAKVIETIKGIPKTYRIRIVKEPDWEEGSALNAQQIHYARMTEFIRREFSLSNGFYDFDIDILAQMLGLAPSTMSTHLRNWNAEGLVQYEPPPRTTPKRIIGDLEQVQFERLRIKRSEAFGKLDYVEGYFNQPDDKKREYLRDYFLATAGD